MLTILWMLIFNGKNQHQKKLDPKDRFKIIIIWSLKRKMCFYVKLNLNRKEKKYSKTLYKQKIASQRQIIYF